MLRRSPQFCHWQVSESPAPAVVGVAGGCEVAGVCAWATGCWCCCCGVLAVCAGCAAGAAEGFSATADMAKKARGGGEWVSGLGLAEAQSADAVRARSKKDFQRRGSNAKGGLSSRSWDRAEAGC